MNFQRKPDWIRTKLHSEATFSEVQQIVEKNGLHTICTSGRCPNQSECWNKGTATLMILGEICTRACRFCNTLTGQPLPPDATEPERIAQSIRLLHLRHAVITSVDRDDLPDKGASHWAKTIRAVKIVNPDITLETLIPDFDGETSLLDLVIAEKPDIISHNLETVSRLTPKIRSKAKYQTSLKVLQYVSSCGITAKTGIMVGLGETEDEIFSLMDDALKAGCSVLTIGQYLQPSRKNIPVHEYISPKKFEEYRQIGLAKGFRHVESGPFVRSSYHAEKHVL
jgi:lipoic acid synthetase